MARIRTIKPEFWSSEQVMSCSISARLLFVGMLNFADDNGVIRGSYIYLKAKIFPADDFNPLVIDEWMCELVNNNLVHKYTVSPKEVYFYITGFSKHQRIDKPTPSSLPMPEDYES